MRILIGFLALLAPSQGLAETPFSDQFDLSLYRVEAVHEDWRVICDVEIVDSATSYQNCAVENDFGLIIYLTTQGVVFVALRGFRPDDALVINRTEFDFEECGPVACGTYLRGIPLTEGLSGAQLRIGGNLHEVRLTGLNEAEEDALARVQQN